MEALLLGVQGGEGRDTRVYTQTPIHTCILFKVSASIAFVTRITLTLILTLLILKSGTRQASLAFVVCKEEITEMGFEQAERQEWKAQATELG